MFSVGVSVGLLENIGFGDSSFLSTKSMQVTNQMQVVTRKYSASVATTKCQDRWEGGVGPQVKKFEQVSRDDHQMPLAGGGSQTHACENITFPQLLVWAVNIMQSNIIQVLLQLSLKGFGKTVTQRLPE